MPTSARQILLIDAGRCGHRPLQYFNKIGRKFMLKHIVMWKFKDAEGKTKDENIEIVKNGLEALPPLIPHIKKLTFLKNQVECERNFDALLVVETENEEELEKYKVHPEHKKVAAYVAKVTEGRGAVDIFE